MKKITNQDEMTLVDTYHENEFDKESLKEMLERGQVYESFPKLFKKMPSSGFDLTYRRR